MLPWTSVKTLVVDVLKARVPLTEVVLAVAMRLSWVTVWPAAIVTALQLFGINPPFHVEKLDQLPVPALATAPHPPLTVTVDPKEVKFAMFQPFKLPTRT